MRAVILICVALLGLCVSVVRVAEVEYRLVPPFLGGVIGVMGILYISSRGRFLHGKIVVVVGGLLFFLSIVTALVSVFEYQKMLG